MKDQCVIKLTDHFVFGDLFDHPKIDHQSLFRIIRLLVDFTRECHMQMVCMAMDVFAWAIVSEKRMCHIECEDLGNSYGIVEHFR